MDTMFFGKIGSETGTHAAFIPRRGETKTKGSSTFIGGPIKYNAYNHEIYMGLPVLRLISCYTVGQAVNRVLSLHLFLKHFIHTIVLWRKGGTMKRLLIFLLLLPVFITGCSKNSSAQKTDLVVAKAWELPNLTRSNSMMCTAFYENQFYYVQDFANNFAVRRINMDGEETLRFEIPRGKGPGEASHSLGIVVNKEGVYFSDFALRRISRFDFEGNYEDCMDFNTDTGIIVQFDMIDGFMFAEAMDTIYLGKIDLKTGEMLASIPREGKTLQKVGSNFSGGVVACDPYNGEIYIGNISAPYKIERFDRDLKKLGEYNYKLEKEYKPAKIYPGPNIAGDFAVTSMAVTKDHIYAPHIGLRYEILGDGRTSSKSFKPEILSFNKKTGKFDHTYQLKDAPEMDGSFDIIYADDEKFICMFQTNGDWVKYIYPENTPEFTQSLVVLKRSGK